MLCSCDFPDYPSLTQCYFFFFFLHDIKFVLTLYLSKNHASYLMLMKLYIIEGSLESNESNDH